MVFRLFDAAAAGNEIIRDTHSGAGAVVVNNGLFDTLIGGGTVADGAGPGVYTDVGLVFRDFTNVWLEIEVNGEILTPRIRLGSVGHALNAGYAESVGGVGAGQFLRSDASDQFTNGTLTINAGTILDVAGLLKVTTMFDRDNVSYYVDPAGAGTSISVAGDIQVETGMGMFGVGDMYLGGTNARGRRRAAVHQLPVERNALRMLGHQRVGHARRGGHRAICPATADDHGLPRELKSPRAIQRQSTQLRGRPRSIRDLPPWSFAHGFFEWPTAFLTVALGRPRAATGYSGARWMSAPTVRSFFSMAS